MFRLFLASILVAVCAAAAKPEQFQTSAGMLELTPIQHASLMIRAGGKVLYVDPAQGKYDIRPKADYTLLADIRGEHVALPLVERLSKQAMVVLGPAEVAKS